MRGNDGGAMKYEFIVEGIPQPAGSKRGFAIKKGGHYTGSVAITDANKKSKPWQAMVKAAAKAAGVQLMEGSIMLTVDFYRDRPMSHYRSGANCHMLKPNAPKNPITKPDTTKLLRGVEDALTGIAWKDDAQVVTQYVNKRFGPPGCRVTIQSLE